MTLAEFLEWEEGQSLRYEFDGVGPVAMVGGSVRHAQIQRNLAFALTARLRGKPSQFLGSDLKIQTEEDHARYPDGIVICSPLAKPDVRDLHDRRHPVHHNDLVAPVELIGLARRERQRHIGVRRLARVLLAPGPAVTANRVVTALVAERLQLLKNPNERQPLARWLAAVLQKQ